MALADCQNQDLRDYGIFRILLGRADTINLTQWREGRKGRKDAVVALSFPFSTTPVILALYCPSFPLSTPSPFPLSTARHSRSLPPSFPRKRESRRPATRNQVQIAAGGSLLPSWAYRGRFRNSSFWRRLERLWDMALANRVRNPKSSTNSSQRIPSPFMGEG